MLSTTQVIFPENCSFDMALLLKKPRGFTKVTLRRVAYQARFFKIDDHPTHPVRYAHVDQDIRLKFASIAVQKINTITRYSGAAARPSIRRGRP